MTTMEFACDRVDDSTLARAAQWLEEHGRAPLASWLLVDAALVDGARLSSLSKTAGFAWVNSLERSSLAVFGDRAPRLLTVRDAGHAPELLQSLTLPDRTAPAFSFFTSAAPTSELQDLFGYLALPEVEGGLELHCRFADTRVLPSLLRTLSPAQARRVGSLIDEWRWFGRTNNIERWGASTNAMARDADSPESMPRIGLSNQQFASILDAGEADLVFSSLVDKTPEVVPKKHRGQFHSVLQTHLDAATRRFVVQPPDRLQFVVLCLTCGEQFDRHPDLEPTWKSVRESKASLVALMKTWSDQLWHELEGLAEPAR